MDIAQTLINPCKNSDLVVARGCAVYFYAFWGVPGLRWLPAAPHPVRRPRHGSRPKCAGHATDLGQSAPATPRISAKVGRPRHGSPPKCAAARPGAPRGGGHGIAKEIKNGVTFSGAFRGCIWPVNKLFSPWSDRCREIRKRAKPTINGWKFRY